MHILQIRYIKQTNAWRSFCPKRKINTNKLKKDGEINDQNDMRNVMIRFQNILYMENGKRRMVNALICTRDAVHRALRFRVCSKDGKSPDVEYTHVLIS